MSSLFICNYTQYQRKIKMTERSRLEINIRRLLGQCELLAKEDLNTDWKLEMYVEALQDMIEKLQTSQTKPPRDIMVKYIKRVEFLKGILNTKKLASPVERAVAAQMLPANIIMPNESTGGPSITSQIHQKTTAKYGQEIRNELFKSNSENEMRKRLLGSADDNESLNVVLQHNRDMQEKVAENMIILAKNLKEHALAANTIIKKDVQNLDQSDKITDRNAVKLKSESLKLEEHTKSTWRCWLWLMIAFVVVVFFNTIVFMKIAKKKK